MGSAAVEQSRCEANMVAQGDGKFGPSGLESVRLGKCLAWKVSSLESVKFGKCQIWKVSSLESVKFGKCQNLESVRIIWSLKIPYK